VQGTIKDPQDNTIATPGTAAVEKTIPHSWVLMLSRVTREGRAQAQSVSEPEASDVPRIAGTHWEALTGQQFDIYGSDAGAGSSDHALPPNPFVEIHAVFRHDCYLVNLQRDARLPGRRTEVSPDQDGARRGGYAHHANASNKNKHGPKGQVGSSSFSFDFNDDVSWLPFPLGVTAGPSSAPESATVSPTFSSLRHPGALLGTLSPGPAYGAAIDTETRIENVLKDEIAKWRATELSLPTVFDDQLSIIFQVLCTRQIGYAFHRGSNGEKRSRKSVCHVQPRTRDPPPPR